MNSITKPLNLEYSDNLISDMYNQYIDYVDKYFPNPVSVIDSFHVSQWIIRTIINHILIRLAFLKMPTHQTKLSRKPLKNFDVSKKDLVLLPSLINLFIIFHSLILPILSSFYKHTNILQYHFSYY